MSEGLSTDLLFAAMAVMFIGAWIVSRYVPLHVALFILFIKVGITCGYFAWVSEAWRLFDDINYLNGALNLAQEGYTPVTAFLDPKGFVELRHLAGGSHFLYYWWNLFAIYFLGEHYYASVFFNILLTCVCGFFFYGILKELEFEDQYRRWFVVFFLLHWDILAWSSFINLKDTLVMTLTTIALFLTIRISRRPKFYYLIFLAFVLYLFQWLRFYIPYLLLTAISAWLTLLWRGKRYYLILILIGGIFSLLSSEVYQNLGKLQGGDIDFKLIKFVLTPKPWNIEDNYSFLFLSASLHWLLFPQTLLGGWLLWKSSDSSKLPIIYCVVVVLFYTFAPQLLGPRHRYQISPIIAWMQFHVFWKMMRHFNARKRFT